ncbi:hypothetical protein [Paraburkholderia sp.]|uniref:hypothetical protein n=1 Tax=Paraburkholderia sp. TaxID=1926495 RepID=UPI003D6E9D6D
MKIREIALHIDFESVAKRGDLSGPALDILREAIDHGDLRNFLKQEGNLDEYSHAGMVGLLQLRSKNLAKQGREHYGFTEALEAVEKLGDDERISWMAIPTLRHLLVLLINVSNRDVIGCMSLRRLDKERPKIPPNWDGSEVT